MLEVDLKGFQKNIKPLNGIPLIYYSIDLAKKISKQYNSKIALSTDDIDILNTSKKMDYSQTI